MTRLREHDLSDHARARARACAQLLVHVGEGRKFEITSNWFGQVKMFSPKSGGSFE
jgi:hypothetical protein